MLRRGLSHRLGKVVWLLCLPWLPKQRLRLPMFGILKLHAGFDFICAHGLSMRYPMNAPAHNAYESEPHELQNLKSFLMPPQPPTQEDSCCRWQQRYSLMGDGGNQEDGWDEDGWLRTSRTGHARSTVAVVAAATVIMASWR